MEKDILLRIKDKVHKLPTTSGVYKMLDKYGNIIYVGKAKNLKQRVSSYFVDTKKPEKVMQMVSNVYDFEYILTLSEIEALQLESNLIHNHMPFYNILLKDGKAFPYIKIDIKKDFPKATITRKIIKDGSLYFGPYFSKISASTILNIINNTFKLRTCNQNIVENKKSSTRACLNYHIEKCLAPCECRVSKDEYLKEVNKVIAFLKGDTTTPKNILENKMKIYAESLNFEKAIEVREIIESLDYINSQNVTGLKQDKDIDILGLATNGKNSVISVGCIRGGKMIGLNNYNVIDASLNESDTMVNFITQYYMSQKVVPSLILVPYEMDFETIKTYLKTYTQNVQIVVPKIGTNKRLIDMVNNNASEFLEKSIHIDELKHNKTIGALKQLQMTANLSQLPKRIEGYDISNLGGTNTVASMVVFINGEPYKKHYRKFRIDTIGQNDFRNMHDIVTRRLNEYKNGKDVSFSQMPDLMLIDGGAIQLEFAHNALTESGLQTDMISLAERDEEIYTLDGNIIKLPRDNYALKLLQNVRDESHRFAITFQKNLREKTALKSELNNIPLIGPKKINNLFEKFKTITNIKNASIDELKQTNGISEKLAHNIYDYFHK